MMRDARTVTKILYSAFKSVIGRQSTMMFHVGILDIPTTTRIICWREMSFIFSIAL